MKSPFEVKALLVAGGIGAGLLWLVMQKGEPTTPPAMTSTEALSYGFALGLGIQIGVRLTGVS